MRIIGIDLSGPSNHKDTVMAVFEKAGNQLKCIKLVSSISDLEILNEISKQSQTSEVVIGVDAPLSYEDGGGDRKGDQLLRQYIISLGMKSGSIMPPTFNRMVYLTLRGIKLSREIANLQTPHPISLVEVHPGAVIGSRLAKEDFEYVLEYKQKLSSRSYLKEWFKSQNVMMIPDQVAQESHMIDACAAALGAWHWKDPLLVPKWLMPAVHPLHPYDYCC
jgi:uncharacterized protein